MKKSLVIFSVLLMAGVSLSVNAQKKVVGYYPSWSKASYPHTSIQFQHLTHIAHAFIFPYADGSLDYTGFSLYPELNTAAHQRGVKVVISVGGWDDVRTPRFSQMAADTTARKKFVSAIIQFILTNNYDGVDLDWEYPKTAADRTNMKLLVHELRIALDATGKQFALAMAGPATGWSGQWFDLESMKNDFDWIGMMTYDFYGAWTSKAGHNSALYGTFAKNTEGWVDYSFTYYNTTRGVPKEKLLIGIPFYGQVFSASALYGASTGGSQSTYTNIVPKIGSGWTRYWDSEAQVPYLINSASTQVISYDDSLSVSLKCTYVKSKGAGGAIIWAIGQDKVSDRQPLLETIGANLTASLEVQDFTSGQVPSTASLDQNFPNPFNGQTIIRYTVSTRSFVSLKVYDVLGREVQTLFEGIADEGAHESFLSSQYLSSGVYLYRLMNTNGFTLTRAMVVLR